LKIYSSDTDASANGHAPPIDDDEPFDDADADEANATEYDYSQLFSAPSYSEFIKTAPNSNSRKYERRVQSLVKAGMVMSLNNQQWPDAATFLKHGPGFAKAAGNLAAEDPRAAQIIDLLTAPDSPWVTFAMVTIPMIAQLARNHQPEMAKAGATMKERRAERKQARLSGENVKAKTPPITVHIGKRAIKLPIRFRLRLPKFKNAFKAFLTPTQHPGQITEEVFSDQSVINALHKMGIYPREP